MMTIDEGRGLEEAVCRWGTEWRLQPEFFAATDVLSSLKSSALNFSQRPQRARASEMPCGHAMHAPSLPDYFIIGC